jgi:MFS family permease
LVVVTWVLFGNPAILRGHTVGILMGIASGAAMLPYTVIKEANPPELGGTATGVINFLNFTFSALLGPVFGARLVEMPEGDSHLALAHYQAGFKPLLYGIIAALILTFFLKETGPASRKSWIRWFTHVVVGAAVIETLADLDLEYPEVGENKLKELAAAKKKLLSK